MLTTKGYGLINLNILVNTRRDIVPVQILCVDKDGSILDMLKNVLTLNECKNEHYVGISKDTVEKYNLLITDEKGLNVIRKFKKVKTVVLPNYGKILMINESKKRMN